MSFFVIFFSLIFYGVPIASLIIWYKTKDATNKYLKILYKIRFSFALIALLASIILDFILDRYGLLGDPLNLNFSSKSYEAGEIIGALFGRYLMIYLMMRKWVK